MGFLMEDVNECNNAILSSRKNIATLESESGAANTPQGFCSNFLTGSGKFWNLGKA